MAKQQTQTSQEAQGESQSLDTRPRHDHDERLRGGIEGGEVARLLAVRFVREGTPGSTSPAWGTHVERPSRYLPRTDLPLRPLEGVARLASGKTPDDIENYIQAITFLAKKDTLIQTARHNGAPDVVTALPLLPGKGYANIRRPPSRLPPLA